MKKALILGLVACSLMGAPVQAAEDAEAPKSVDWSFDGIFGHYDRASLQRGMQVYKEVCAACHGMRLLAYRNLMDLGYSEAQVKAFASQYEVQNEDPNDEGEMFNRPALPSDRFVSPFPNEQAARASNGGALPVDLSLIVKARAGGADYIYSVLSGYAEAPKDLKKPDTLHYNPYFPGDVSAYWKGDPHHAPKGGMIAMPPPLGTDKVTFDDGKPSTVAQQARDVTAFLAWASEPKMEERKQFGLGAMIYLLLFTVLLWFSYKRIWRNVAH